jgi:hypothetical protein
VVSARGVLFEILFLLGGILGWTGRASPMVLARLREDLSMAPQVRLRQHQQVQIMEENRYPSKSACETRDRSRRRCKASETPSSLFKTALRLRSQGLGFIRFCDPSHGEHDHARYDGLGLRQSESAYRA